MLRSTPPPKWLWIGNSNTRPHITHFDNEFRKFVLCTKIEQFKSEISRAPDTCDYLTISGLDTLIADLGQNTEINAEILEGQLDKIFIDLEGYRTQGMKIVVEPLLLWKKHSEPLKRAAMGAYKFVKNKYLGILFPPKPDSLKFNPDGVHLTERAGAKLFTAMYNASVKFFEEKEDSYETATESATESDSSMNSETEIQVVSNSVKKVKQPKPSTNQRKFTSNSRKPADVQTVNLENDDDEEDRSNRHSFGNNEFVSLKDFLALKDKIEKRWSVDLFASAGTKEDLDKIENEKNMDKIIFSGIEIHDLWAEDLTWAIRLEKIKAALEKLIKTIDPTGTYKIGYVRHLNFNLKAMRQIFEVNMGSETEAKGLRKAYGAKIKEWRENNSFPEEVKGTSLGPSLTLATRVRISILKVYAKEIKSAIENTDSWVIQHIARPILKVQTTNNDGTTSIASFGFVQAVAYVKKELPHSNFKTQDFYEAYSIAGSRFGQEISHHFIVLDCSSARSVAINRKPRNKRPAPSEKKQTEKRQRK